MVLIYFFYLIIEQGLQDNMCENGAYLYFRYNWAYFYHNGSNTHGFACHTLICIYASCNVFLLNHF
jgi:hypothetical protein